MQGSFPLQCEKKECWKPYCALDGLGVRWWCVWHSFDMQGLIGIMLPVAQVVGVPTSMACATQERRTSVFADWIAHLLSSLNLLVRLPVRGFR